jgi:hypothetical protein
MSLQGRAALAAALWMALAGGLVRAQTLGPREKGDGPEAALPRKDPLVEAFVLPHGVVPRPDQVAELNKLRQRYEPILRSALRKLEQATTEKEKTPAAKEVLRLRAEIRAAIQAILATPDPKAIARAKEMQKKQAEQRKKAQHKRGGKPKKKKH